MIHCQSTLAIMAFLPSRGHLCHPAQKKGPPHHRGWSLCFHPDQNDRWDFICAFRTGFMVECWESLPALDKHSVDARRLVKVFNQQFESLLFHLLLLMAGGANCPVALTGVQRKCPNIWLACYWKKQKTKNELKLNLNPAWSVQVDIYKCLPFINLAVD